MQNHSTLKYFFLNGKKDFVPFLTIQEKKKVGLNELPYSKVFLSHHLEGILTFVGQDFSFLLQPFCWPPFSGQL